MSANRSVLDQKRSNDDEKPNRTNLIAARTLFEHGASRNRLLWAPFCCVTRGCAQNLMRHLKNSENSAKTVAERFGFICVLRLYEAHAMGVLGPQGGGLARAAGLDTQSCPVLMLTFGKALGSAGAAILGSTQVIESIINFSRPWIYTMAMPPALAAATTKSVEIARGANHLRAQLAENIARWAGAVVSQYTLKLEVAPPLL